MPAGSVRLPELKQDIKVDTKDLVKAEAAAKRFKQAMNRNLKIDDSDFDRSLAGLEKKLDAFTKKNRQIKVDLDLDTTKAREKLKEIRNEKVKINVDVDTARARKKIQDLGRDVKVRVDLDTRAARTQLRNLGRQVRVRLELDTRAALTKIKALGDQTVTVRVDANTVLARAKIKALSGQDIRVHIDVDVDEAVRKIQQLSAEARASVRSLDGASGGLTRMSRSARLAGQALGGLSIAGVVGGGIGILGAAAIGAGSALQGAAPAALALTGAIGGLGVAAGGLAAIFKSNEGLKGSSKILQDAFQGIQDDLQRRVNPSILEFMHSVAGLAPIAREMVPPFAQAFTEITQMFSNLLKDTNFQNDLRAIVTEGIKQFRQFGEGARNALQGIISLAAATGPHITKLAEGFKETTAEFRNWVNEARQTGELNRMLETSFTILKSLGRTVRDLAIGFKQMFQAADFSGFTATVLATLEGIGQDFRNFTRDRQADMQAMFANLKGQFAGFRGLIASLADGIREILTHIDLTPLMRGIQAIVPELAKALTEFTNALARVAEQAAPAINSILGLIRGVLPSIERLVTTIVKNVTQVVDAVRPGIERFAQMLASIGDKVIPVIAGAARNLGAAFSAAMIVIKPVGEFLGAIIGLLGDMSGVVGVAISAFLGFKIVQGILAGAGQGLRNLATGTTAAGQKVGVLGRGVRALVQPFAAATVGAGNLAKGLVEASRGQQTLATSSSGLLRGLSQMGQGFTEATTKAQQAGTGIQTASRAFTAFDGAATRIATGPLRVLGASLIEAGTRLKGLAGEATTTSQRITQGLGQGLTQAGAAINTFSGRINEVAAALSSRLGSAFTTAGTYATRLGSTLSDVAAAGFKGLQSAASGLIGALGGPWGVAITAAVTALTIMSQRSQEAQAQVAALRGAFDQSGGAIDANIQKMIQSNLETSNLAAGADALGMSQTQLAQTVTQGGAAYDAALAKINELAGGMQDGLGITNELGANLGFTSAKYGELSQAMQEQKRVLDETKRAYEEQQKALTTQAQSLTNAQRSAEQVKKGFDEMGKSAGDSSKFVDGLSTALDGISGRSKSADEANKAFGESLRGMAQAAQQGGEGIKILNGDLDEQSASGAKAYDAVTQLREATLQKAAADFQAAGGTSNLQAAQAAATQAINQGKQAMVDSLTQMGANREEAQKYADKLFAIPPEVMTKILADPANAEKIVADWRAGVQNAPPVPAPVGANVGPLEAITAEALRRITGAPPAPAPVGADPRAFDEAVKKKMAELKGGAPTPAPVGANTNPLDTDVGKAQTNIEGSQANLPVSGNLVVEQQVQAFVARLNAYQAAILPVNANVQPGEQQALAWVARINGFTGAALPISANIDQLNQQYNQAYTFITNTVIFAKIAGNIDLLNQTYAQAYQFISTTIIIAPVTGDFSQLMALYQQIVQQMQSTPIIIPVYGQFMGIQGLPGGGGMAAGGIIANEKGRLIEYFDNGGMSARDHVSLKSAAGSGESKYPDRSALDGMATAKGMGLTPMSANRASIVAPNTWRVIGDRAQDDESYIPINNSARSTQILEETAKRMGYALEKFATGGFSSSSPTSASSSSPSAAVRDSVASSTVNNNEAPLIGGDLVVSVPAGTSPQEAMSEVVFQMRRAKRGGVHRRGTSGVHR